MFSGRTKSFDEFEAVQEHATGFHDMNTERLNNNY